MKYENTNFRSFETHGIMGFVASRSWSETEIEQRVKLPLELESSSNQSISLNF